MSQVADVSLLEQRRNAHLFVSSFLQSIAPDACFSAASLIAEHPHLAATKSAVLDLALEEYCRRETAGDVCDALDFSRQFPGHASSVLHLLQLRQLLEAESLPPTSAGFSWPTVGDQMLGYVLLDELGRGAHSRVFLATQIDIGERLVVLKVSPNPATEVNALGRLVHPNIVPLHSVEFDRQRGVSLICMPYSGAATLYDVIYRVHEQKRIPRSSAESVSVVQSINARFSDESAESNWVEDAYVEFVIRIGSEIASALECTHRHGFCHFDIKPTNVLLCRDGKSRIIDFNLSATTSQQKSRGGTVPYMSPEQLQHYLDVKAVVTEGPPSDVFSLGVLLYELLAGRHPLQQLSGTEDLCRVAADFLELYRKPICPLRRLNPLADRQLEKIVHQCLGFNPGNRPDAAALHSELVAALSRRRRAIRWMLEHQRLLSRTVAAAGVLTLLSGWYLAQREPAAIQAVRKGDAAFSAGDLTIAEREYTRSIAADASQSESWFRRGRCHLQLGDFQAACADFLESRRLSSDAKSAAYAGYCLCLSQKDWPQAISLLEEAKSLGVATIGLDHDLAYCYLMIQDPENAEACLQPCLSHKRVDGATYFLAAKAQHQMCFKSREGRSLDEMSERLSKAGLLYHRAIQSGYVNGTIYLDAAIAQALLSRLQNEPAEEAAKKVQPLLDSASGYAVDQVRVDEVISAYPMMENWLERRPSPHEHANQSIASAPPLLDPFWPNHSATAVLARR